MSSPAAARRDAEEALRPVSDDEAQEILSRFIASHFRKHDREHARFRIPADPEHDDDLRMSQYIRETRALRALLAAEQSAPEPCPVDHSTCSRCGKDTKDDAQVFVLCDPCWGATVERGRLAPTVTPVPWLEQMRVIANPIMPKGAIFIHPDTLAGKLDALKYEPPPTPIPWSAPLSAPPAAPAPSAPTPLHFVCTDFPGPGNECVFVECEDGGGHGVNAGEWVRRPDGLVALVVTALPAANPCSVCRQPLARHRHGGPCSCRFCCNRPLPLDGDGRDGDNGAGPFEE